MTDFNKINKIIKDYNHGKKDIAYSKLKKIFIKNQDNNKIRYNLAIMEQELNLNVEAKNNYKYLIESENNHKAMINLYNIYIKEENYIEALNLVNNILKINKNILPLYQDKVFLIYKLKRYEEARKLCNTLIKQYPKNINYYNIIGLCYLEIGDFDNSEKYLNTALAIEKNNIQLLNSLGRLNHEKRNSKKAEEFFLKALDIDSNSYQVINNIAGFYREEGKYIKAINYYKKSMLINPNSPSIINNLAKTYFDIGKTDEAKKYCLKALSLNQNDGNIKKILSFIYLKEQDFEKGWDYFDGRLNLSDFVEKNKTINLLRNKIIKENNFNKDDSILILREQGIGDEILYGTMYEDALNTWKNAIIECDKRLLNIFQNSYKKYKDRFINLGTISENEEKIKRYKHVVYAGSLGKYFRRTNKDFTQKLFLKPNDNLVKHSKEELDKFKKEYNIGISWKSQKNRYANEKSLKLVDLINVFNTKNCNFINLQYGDTMQEVDDFNKKNNLDLITIKNFDIFNEIDKLASILSSLDLFISVSNSTAHLAGSLGVKTILIKPINHALFHYWNYSGEKTPWYNSIRLVDKEKIMNEKNLVKDSLGI